MFEAAELGRRVSKKKFQALEPELHTKLLEAQRSLSKAEVPVIVIVSGVEGAGKGDVVGLLHRWLDTRGIQTHAFWDETGEEAERPRYWRFWRCMPPQGTIAVMFGSWYTKPIIDRVFKRCTAFELSQELARIRDFERLLIDGGALIIKLWFHLSKQTQRKRLQADAKDRARSAHTSPTVEKFSKRYDRFAEVSERAIRETDTGHAPWHLVEATDHRYRDLTVGRTLLSAIRARLQQQLPVAAPPRVTEAPNLAKLDTAVTILNRVDLTRTLTETRYRQRLSRLQKAIRSLAWQAFERGVVSVAVFEGWDASGKGGVIRRITRAIDPRLYRVISVAAPTDEERAQHYLWRFWRHLPRKGHMTLYDRSWYGRVLVERVEGFATEEAWKRSYREINDFEDQLTQHGIVVAKFWLHVSPDEQLARFKEREQTPWKQHKITDEDWRNREKWDAYERAVNDMITHTSTGYAPWTIVAGNDKRFARIQVLESFRERLASALK